jgi:hypothetical protein
MEQKIKDLEEKDRSAQSDIASFKRQVRFLKRKRRDNIPPPASPIPIGFYYAKWLKKLNFYIGQIGKEIIRDNSPPGKSASNTPVPTPQKTSSSLIASFSAANLVVHETMKSLMEKRAAIFDDREDNQLKVKDRSVFMYRSNRLVHWAKTQEEAGGSYMTEEEHDAQYDQEQLDLVHAAMYVEAKQKHRKNTTEIRRWPCRARALLSPLQGSPLSPFLR